MVNSSWIMVWIHGSIVNGRWSIDWMLDNHLLKQLLINESWCERTARTNIIKNQCLLLKQITFNRFNGITAFKCNVLLPLVLLLLHQLCSLPNKDLSL